MAAVLAPADAGGVMAVKRVAVIGGGPAGLSAAVSLAESGVAVTLLEAAARVGGLLQTDDLDGARVDTAVQLVSSTHSAVFDLAGRIGAGDVLQAAPGRDALWRKGRAHGITYGSVSSMVASGALPTMLKLKLGTSYLPFLKRDVRTLDANEPAATGGVAFDGESIAAWGQRELGDDFVELLVYPLLAAYYGATPEETSAAVYHALARVGMDVKVYGAAGGFAALADAAAHFVEARDGRIEVDQRVTQLSAGAGDVVIDGDRFDAAVIAVPASIAAGLLEDSGAAQWLQQVEERRTFTVAYRLDREFPADWFGLSFPRTAEVGGRVAVVCVQRNKLPDETEGGDALLVIPAPGAAQQLYDRADDEIAGMLLSDLERAVPGVTRRAGTRRVYRHATGYTVFGPGHLGRIRGFDHGWLPSRVALAGDYLVAPSVEGAVRSGTRAARRVLEALDALGGAPR
jgi:protoporphyrinogen/coproporphyrinogen III oxidase